MSVAFISSLQQTKQEISRPYSTTGGVTVDRHLHDYPVL
jgi:hypothetical protein